MFYAAWLACSAVFYFAGRAAIDRRYRVNLFWFLLFLRKGTVISMSLSSDQLAAIQGKLDACKATAVARTYALDADNEAKQTAQQTAGELVAAIAADEAADADLLALLQG